MSSFHNRLFLSFDKIRQLVGTIFLLLFRQFIRSMRSQIFFKIRVLKNFALFTGKLLCWSLFLINIQYSLFNS